jgi:hypothetical protein
VFAGGGFSRPLESSAGPAADERGIGRWTSNGAVGSEFTGLYFDPTNRRCAWVNLQHPDSDNDRTIEITIPE